MKELLIHTLIERLHEAHRACGKRPLPVEFNYNHHRDFGQVTFDADKNVIEVCLVGSDNNSMSGGWE